MELVMEDYNEDRNVHRKERPTALVIDENVLEEMITAADNPYAASDFAKLSCKSNPFSTNDSSDYHTISLHDNLSAHLSLSSSDNMKEVTTSTDRKAPSCIDNSPLKTVDKDATEEEVMVWRLGMGDFPFVLSECGDSSYDSSVSERSSVISSPCTSFTVHSDTRSEYLDGIDIWVSSLDLDEENSAFLQEKEHDVCFLSSDFPSPSFSPVRCLHFGASTSGEATSHREEDSDSDEPIFWPFERTSYNSPEFDKFLSVSPRRNTADTGFAEIRRLNPIMQRLHKSKISSPKKNNEPHRGNVSLGAKGTKSPQDKVQKVSAVPSLLSRTTKTPSKQQSPHTCEKRRPPQLKISPPRKCSSPQSPVVYPLQGLEARDIQNLAKEKNLIEQFIGLDEFDGHEGISSDPSNCLFSLCLSPR